MINDMPGEYTMALAEREGGAFGKTLAERLLLQAAATLVAQDVAQRLTAIGHRNIELGQKALAQMAHMDDEAQAWGAAASRAFDARLAELHVMATALRSSDGAAQ